MIPLMGLRRISVVSKRCLRNSGSWRSPNTALVLEDRDFHAVEAEVVLAACVVAGLEHVVERGVEAAAGDAGGRRGERGDLWLARLLPPLQGDIGLHVWC